MKFLMKNWFWCCWRGRYRTVTHYCCGFWWLDHSLSKDMITTKIAALQLDDEVLNNMAVHSTENTEWTTTESMARQMPELPVENVNTEEEIDLDDLTITGDYSDYDILEE